MSPFDRDYPTLSHSGGPRAQFGGNVFGGGPGPGMGGQSQMDGPMGRGGMPSFMGGPPRGPMQGGGGPFGGQGPGKSLFHIFYRILSIVVNCV